jgi:hypothetical protein
MYPLILSDFNETYNFLVDFWEKTQISNFMKISPVGAEVFHGDRKMDIQMDRQT